MRAFFKTIFKPENVAQIITFVMMATPLSIWGQQRYEIEVSAGSQSHSDLPVSVPLSEFQGLPLEQMRLVEVIASGQHEQPFQVLDSDAGAQVYWILDGAFPAGSRRKFVFEQHEAGAHDRQSIDMSEVDIQLKGYRGNVLLGYRHAIQPVPEGVSARYSRAGFVHPLNTPAGETLTRIQPSDHYHHYGLWNPWTRIEYQGKTYDLWNLNDNLGTVRFGGFDATYEGKVLAGFDAVHHHVIFDEGREDTVIHENWKISIFPEHGERYLVDIESILKPQDDEGHDVILKEYRYGGLGMRAREEWTNQNSDILTASGKTWDEADGSLERWTIVSGELGERTGGILFMSYPENYNFPEPIRVWPRDGNGGRGDQFFNFSPTKDKDWVLTSGQEYTLKYRLLVFDGQISPEEAEQYWQSFANPPTVSVKPL
ncbi:MAG: PmoA family protein [Sphingobacterium sp.]